MTLLVCSDCSTRYAVGLECCPHCGSACRAEDGEYGLVPFLDVACGAPECEAFGRVRRVYLRRPVPGVVEMPGPLVCEPCGSAMSALDGGV
ncbi:hypothetical protein ABZW11_17150 [Nonomuraea sp. NPDC004580]|uniref:hypothetical protein n=1 Tax=Nonomuraea sp. NPDC004580 TaxID=3154552 RepID=UPI0033AF2B27